MFDKYVTAAVLPVKDASDNFFSSILNQMTPKYAVLLPIITTEN